MEASSLLKEVKWDIAGMVDMKRYIVTVDEERGLAATYSRTTERNRNREAFRRAQLKLKQHNMRSSHNSFSTIYTKKGFRDYTRQALEWQQWHSSWVFGFSVSVQLPPDMATPGDIARIEQVDIDDPDDIGRIGIISGSEPSCISGSEQSDDDDDSADEGAE